MDIHAAALRLLNYRLRSVVEMERKLTDRGFEAGEIAEEIARLTEAGWLDDSRFAREYAGSRLRARKGSNRIERELRGFGVDKSVIRVALEDVGEEEDEIAHLKDACRKKSDQISRRHGPRYLAEDRGRKKLVSYLLSQGYDPTATYEAVDAEISRQRASEGLVGNQRDETE